MKLSPSSSQLSRWFGDDHVEGLSRAMKGWYGPPIVAGLSPTRSPVLIHRDGDFSGGSLLAGGFWSLRDHLDFAAAQAVKRSTFNTGFTGLADFILKGKQGYARRVYPWQKAGASAALQAAASHWGVGSNPAAGAAGGAAPAGVAPTKSTTGALPFVDSDSGKATFFAGGYACPSASGGSATLVYDRLFAVTKTMASTGTETVSGNPARYQATPGNGPDTAEGNFLFTEVFTGLSGTAHNWTTCLYTDESGNTGQTLPSFAGVALQTANRLDLALGSWFAPLAAGDTGIKALTQMQCDASVTGAVDFVIGHPIGWLPSFALANQPVRTEFRRPLLPTRIYDNACLAFLQVMFGVSGSSTWSGVVETMTG